MLDIIDSTNTTDCVIPELPAVTESPTEQELGEEIASLWSAHTGVRNTAKATRDGLRDIRAKLGEQLCRMKEVLACPGREGQWSSFLREHQIPRATADRLVARHLRFLNPDANRIGEAISDPAEEEIQKVFASAWPKLRRTLRTPQSLYCFIDGLTAASCDGKCRRITDEGILVLKPQQADLFGWATGGQVGGLLLQSVSQRSITSLGLQTRRVPLCRAAYRQPARGLKAC